MIHCLGFSSAQLPSHTVLVQGPNYLKLLSPMQMTSCNWHVIILLGLKSWDSTLEWEIFLVKTQFLFSSMLTQLTMFPFSSCWKYARIQWCAYLEEMIYYHYDLHIVSLEPFWGNIPILYVSIWFYLHESWYSSPFLSVVSLLKIKFVARVFNLSSLLCLI